MPVLPIKRTYGIMEIMNKFENFVPEEKEKGPKKSKKIARGITAPPEIFPRPTAITSPRLLSGIIKPLSSCTLLSATTSLFGFIPIFLVKIFHIELCCKSYRYDVANQSLDSNPIYSKNERIRVTLSSYNL